MIMQDLELRLRKTKRKEQMADLQKLGLQLVNLSEEKLQKIELPPVLFDAIILAKKLTANGAIRRHNQYIGRLMREVDADYIRSELAKSEADSVYTAKLLHSCEKWRERLLDNDGELNLFINEYVVDDISELKSLIRSARREKLLQAQIKNYRKLFKLIRDIIEHSGIEME